MLILKLYTPNNKPLNPQLPTPKLPSLPITLEGLPSRLKDQGDSCVDGHYWVRQPAEQLQERRRDGTHITSVHVISWDDR